MLSFDQARPARSDVDWCWYLRRQGKSGEALERILHDIGVMDPGGWADWAPSKLTSTGSPVEMAFAADQLGLQLTTEVADPAANPSGRVDLVCSIMQRYGAAVPNTALREIISAAQGAGPLQYGAWLGLRQDNDRLHCQLLAEIPETASDLTALLAQQNLGPTLSKLGDGLRTKMVIFDGSTGATCIRFELANATRSCLPILADAAQVSPQILSNAIDGLTGAKPNSALPFKDLGFCFTDCGADRPSQLRISFSAKDALGSDAEISQWIRACGGQKFKGYSALVDELPRLPKQKSHHGCVSMIARQSAAPTLCADVAAPWDYQFDEF